MIILFQNILGEPSKLIVPCLMLICASLFLSLNKSTCQTRKNVFYFTWKALFVREKINFKILHFRILRCHQMPKNKTTNTFYWITWELNSLLMKFGQFMSYYKKKKFIKQFCKNHSLKTSSRPFCFYKELSTTSIGQWNFWSKLLLLLAKLSKFVQITTLTSSDSVLQRILS